MEKKQYFYKIYGVIFVSEIEYPQLIKAPETKEPDIVLCLGDIQDEDLYEDYSNRIFCVNQSKIHFSNHKGCFLIQDGKKIEMCPKKGVALEELTPFVFGYGMAMIFFQRGKLAIHCSAVKFLGKAFLICGGSGSGKSTLTAKLLENGAELLTDDVAVVDISPEGKAMVYPAFPQQKLCRDAVIRNRMDTEQLLYIDEEKDKFAVSRREKFCDTATELGGVIALNRYNGESVTLQQLKGHATLHAILDNLFLRPLFEQSYALPPEDMIKCLTIAQNVPVYKLLRPLTGDTTTEQIRLLRDIIEE